MRTRPFIPAGLLVLLVVTTACGRAKTSAAPTSKGPSASPTISATPSISPSPSFSPPPPAAIDVFGQIGLQVIILDGATPSKEPFDGLLTIRDVESGGMIPVTLGERGNFSDSLAPGTYAVVNLQIQPPALGKDPAVLETTGTSMKEPGTARPTSSNT